MYRRWMCALLVLAAGCHQSHARSEASADAGPSTCEDLTGPVLVFGPGDRCLAAEIEGTAESSCGLGALEAVRVANRSGRDLRVEVHLVTSPVCDVAPCWAEGTVDPLTCACSVSAVGTTPREPGLVTAHAHAADLSERAYGGTGRGSRYRVSVCPAGADACRCR